MASSFLKYMSIGLAYGCGSMIGGPIGGAFAASLTKAAFAEATEVIGDSAGPEAVRADIIPSTSTGDPLQQSEVFEALFGSG